MAPLDDLVFVFDSDGWLYVKSRADAEGYFEAPDVEAGEFGPAWSATGQQLSITADSDGRRIRDEAESDPDGMERALLAYARERELILEGSGDVVVDVANAVAAWEWHAQWPRRPRWLAKRLRGAEPPRYSRS